MSWNEPGKGRDPWGGNGRDTPPDLDELVRKMQARLRALFGGGPRPVGGNGGRSGGGSLLLVIAGLLLLAVFALSAYRVDAPEQGIVLRLGAYHRTSPPGLHFRIPLIETVEKVNTGRIDNFDYKNQMLTSDENIVYVESNVQFRRDDARPYLFNVRMPDMTLEDVAESAIREVIGKNAAEYVMSGEGRSRIGEDARELMQDTLDAYGTGIRVTQFNLKRVQPPPEVQAAVDDATKAREDKERFRLAAEAYSNDILPRARGAAARQLAEAEAYRERVIADAQGEAARFESLLAEYEAAPEVTRKRLYLETVEAVFRANAKVLVDTGSGSGNNLVYLPMDKLLEQQQQARQGATERPRESATSRTAPREPDRRNAENLRSRN